MDCTRLHHEVVQQSDAVKPAPTDTRGGSRRLVKATNNEDRLGNGGGAPEARPHVHPYTDCITASLYVIHALMRCSGADGTAPASFIGAVLPRSRGSRRAINQSRLHRLYHDHIDWITWWLLGTGRGRSR